MKRLVYRARIHLPYGFHTGDGRRLDVTDQPLFRNADGRLELPGTSIAGVLRADARRLVRALGGPRAECRADSRCRCLTCQVFGPRAKTRRGDEEDPLWASRLYVRGGVACEDPATRIRDHVGIDRRTHTAADRRKYDVEISGPVTFPCLLRIDDPKDDEVELLEAVLRRLAAGWLYLGGKSGSGLGRAELAKLRRHTLDLRDRQQLVKHLLADEVDAGGHDDDLLADGAWLKQWRLAAATPADGDEPTLAPADWGQVRLGLALEFPNGLLVNDPAEALMAGFDHAFTRDHQGRPILPGSSLRGALRTRAEQILRTLAGPDAACDLNTQGSACHQKIGDRLRDDKIHEDEKSLPFDDDRRLHCSACQVFGSGRLASSLKVSDFLTVEGTSRSPRAHEMVAIDRFTGGAADQAKFDAQTSGPVTVQGELTVELGPDRLQPWGLGLLVLVLRDLLVGDVPLGFGSAKGFNEVRARIVSADRFWIHPPEAFVTALDTLDPEPGSAHWDAAKDSDWAPLVGLMNRSPDLADTLRGWVTALDAHVVPREPQPPTEPTTDPERRGQS